MGSSAMRVVIVTMDNHLASAASRAHRLLQKKLPGVSLAVHAASEWADDASSTHSEAACTASDTPGNFFCSSRCAREAALAR